jgi:hypothetical protein
MIMYREINVFHTVRRNKWMCPMVQRWKDRAVWWMFWKVALGELFNVTVSFSDYMLVIGEWMGMEHWGGMMLTRVK